MVKTAASLCSVMCVLLGVGLAEGDFLYTYSGSQFGTISGPPYEAGDGVSIQFRVPDYPFSPDPGPANSFGSRNFRGSILDYQFSDGVQVLTPQNSSANFWLGFSFGDHPGASAPPGFDLYGAIFFWIMDATALDGTGVIHSSRDLCSYIEGARYRSAFARSVSCAGDPAERGIVGRWTVSELVTIDIKPGSFPNSINPRSGGTTPVAILSTANFNALSDVDTASLTFGRTGGEVSLAFCNANGEDVNGDGLLDLVCHFHTLMSGFQSGDTLGILKGQTVGGISIIGQDLVRIVP